MTVSQTEVGRTEGGWWCCCCGLSSPARCAWWSMARWRSHQKREYNFTRNPQKKTFFPPGSEPPGGSVSYIHQKKIHILLELVVSTARNWRKTQMQIMQAFLETHLHMYISQATYISKPLNCILICKYLIANTMHAHPFHTFYQGEKTVEKQ